MTIQIRELTPDVSNIMISDRLVGQFYPSTSRICLTTPLSEADKADIQEAVKSNLMTDAPPQPPDND